MKRSPKRSTFTILAVLASLALVIGGTVLGGGLGIASSLQRPFKSTTDWQPLGSPPGGAAGILDVYASVYMSGGWQLYISGTDGRIYLNDNGAGWQEVTEIAPPSGMGTCTATMIAPPPLPDLAVEARTISSCHAEVIEQYGFARSSDGSLWYWEDVYTGLWALGDLTWRSLGGAGLGCLCGGLLAGVMVGMGVVVMRRKRA
ncbi:MAG: hypothetical protein JW726_19480 [Anaerolineales bacterium]|nr:hypothetical protein [Anaerolineales bacterium]